MASRKMTNFARLGGLLLSCSALPLAAHAAPGPVPLPQLVREVSIPHQDFVLPNGLRVYVVTDRKAPVVAVSVWYHVGSKDEPKGETGFAHLFEHLMFGGSENAPGSYFEPMQALGATDMNGTTWFDRTNYFETVPTAALPMALFLESDRMGHLLGAIDQTKLDTQRGVVQNEKRQGDNQPYGLVEYAQIAAMTPPGHPYNHPTIGSMADLDAASLETVKNWFRAKYGPNNAVLVLAGDIDVATAKTLVAKYFGDIPRGPEVTPAAASVPTLPARKEETLKDRVATVRLYRDWNVPGSTDADLPALDVGASILGGLSSSRLDNALVRGQQIAVRTVAGVQPFERLSQFEVTVDVKPGVDPALVAKQLDAIIADFIAKGPTEDEVLRAVTREVSGRIQGQESVNGKAVTIAEGALYAKDPDFYRKDLAAYAALTPAKVKAALAKWLSRPVYALTVVPGARDAYQESAGGKGSFHPSYYRTPTSDEHPLAPPSKLGTVGPRSFQAEGVAPGAGTVAKPQNPTKPARTPPALGPMAELKFPKVEHARLANGIAVDYAQRSGEPVTRVQLSFDAGNAADPKDKLGLQALMLRVLAEGTTSRNSVQIAEEQERLGASIGAAPGMDTTSVSLSALTPNLAPSLDLLSDFIQHPAFDPKEIERVRSQQLAAIASEMTQPQGIALRVLPPLIYGRDHPYGVPFSGRGEGAAVAKVTRDDMIAFQQAWLRPDNAHIFVVSDKPLAEILPLLDQRFGTWAATGTKGVKPALALPKVPAGSRVLLIDQPNSPQSLILGGEVTPARGTEDVLALSSANDVLGGDFLSRMNMDLRETKHFSYGVGSVVRQVVGPMAYLVFAPVQSNQTGPSLAALISDTKDFLGPKGTTQVELERTINGRTRELPGSFETSGSVLGALQGMALYHRPDDYWDTLATRYRALKTSDFDAAIRRAINPDAMLWVVVGDAKTVRPQLDKLGLPIEVMGGAKESAK